MEIIDPKITPGGSEGVKRIKVFCINNDEDKTEYEELLNNDNVTIMKQDGPTLDKIGRAIIVVTWEEET
jgi:hypothetical protein